MECSFGGNRNSVQNLSGPRFQFENRLLLAIEHRHATVRQGQAGFDFVLSLDPVLPHRLLLAVYLPHIAMRPEENASVGECPAVIDQVVELSGGLSVERRDGVRPGTAAIGFDDVEPFRRDQEVAPDAFPVRHPEPGSLAPIRPNTEKSQGGDQQNDDVSHIGINE